MTKRGCPLFILTAFLLASCADANLGSGGVWYELENGNFNEVPFPKGLPAGTMKPWPEQNRISDVSLFNGRAVCLVSGYGVVLLPDGKSDSRIVPCYDEALFKDRTATLIQPHFDSLFCHYYKDSSFGNRPAHQAGTAEPCVAKLTFDASGRYSYQPFLSVIQKTEPGWQAVGAFSFDAQSIALEWKLSENDHTQFSYTLFNLEKEKDETKDREWFFASYKIEESEGIIPGDEILSALFTVIIRDAGAKNRNVTIHMVVEDQETSVKRRFSHTIAGQPGAQGEYLSVPVAIQNGEYTALFPDGLMLTTFSAKNPEVRRGRLPGLPQGFAYTEFVITPNGYAIVWEQADFYKVGGSGVFVTGRKILE